MSAFDQLANLLLAAERESAGRSVTLDLFQRCEGPLGGASLAPVRGENAAPIGRVVAEDGRICWAMAKGNDLTLSDVLAADSGVPRATFERIYQSARAEGVPFCEKLATSDVIDVTRVRRALRQQAAGCLAALARISAQESLGLSIAGIPRVSYDESFTFGALEMLQATIHSSAELEGSLGRLPGTYARLAPKLQAAVCFREADAAELALTPVSAWCRRDLALGEALELAAQALAATQPADLVAAEISPFALFARDSVCWLAAFDAPHLSLFQVDTQEQYLGLLASLIQDRRD
jgi:hypothetical protein